VVEVKLFGKVRGANTNKFNRVAKLYSMYDELLAKMDGYILRGALISDTARLALAVKLLMTTGIRVGNEASAEGYMTIPHPHSKKEPEFVQTFGLTTLKCGHVEFQSRKAHLNFLGKKQVDNYFEIKDQLTVKALRHIYTYEEDILLGITVRDLTKFIKRSVGKQFSPKDFRTMRANIYAWEAYCKLSKKHPGTKRMLNEEIKSVALYVSEKLNNTPGVCRKSYIDEHLFEYLIETRYP
jgi:DNA topoisomerase-1